MSGYSWIAVLSLFAYAFLFVTFLASENKKRVIHTFMFLLGIMILWNGGSCFMRMQLWPSVNFWHHVSLLGMFMLPVGYFHFLLDFLEDRNEAGRKLWTTFYLVVFAVNCITGFFVPLPEVVFQDGKTQFLYHYNWHIYVLLVFILLTLFQLGLIVVRYCRGNHLAFHQLKPVLWGIVIILLGHVLSTLPIFVGIPVDMLSGVVNALFLFYALYKKRLFRMTILLSRSNCWIIAMLLGTAFFSNSTLVIQKFMLDEMNIPYMYTIIIIAVLLIALIAVLYLIIKRSLDSIFARTEQQQRELITHFDENITHMMSIDEILVSLSDTIQAMINVNRIYVLIRGVDGQYRIEHTTNPLDEKNFYVRSDHPLIPYLKQKGGCTLFKDFSRNTIYRSMWEKEKKLLMDLNLECFVPLMAEDELVGIVMLAGKENKAEYHPNDFAFIQSLSTTCANAVKNAYAYEKALEEAQKDEMTSLINRKFFFELLEREFEKNKDSALSLCILSLDDFRMYNQMYGTLEGNIALQRVAGILASSVNEIGYAARIGGKEFALILPGYDIYTAKCLAENVAEQIRKIKPTMANQVSTRLTVSIGICAAPYIASSAKELYRNADTAVYTVKRSGKDAILMYSADIKKRGLDVPVHKSGYSEHADTIYALTVAIDTKDHYTYQHSQHVAFYAAELAKAAKMSPDLIEIIREAGFLHDIGKIGVPENILNKPGKLTEEEYDVMKGHVNNALDIIRNLPSLNYVIPAVSSHHERYDGYGYPRGLAGEAIPITGRILSIADAFDAITSTRSYKEAMSKEKAVAILREEAGKQFDPKLVDLFTELVENGSLDISEESEVS